MKIDVTIDFADFHGSEYSSLEDSIRDIIYAEVKARVRKHTDYIKFIDNLTAKTIGKIAGGL